MGWFKKNADKESKKPLSPKSSYDLYNESQTQLIKSNDKENLLVAYTEELSDKKDVKDKMNDTKSIKTTQSSGRRIYYVSARKDKDGKKIGWEVKKEKAAKITKLCATKAEAIALVKELASNQGYTCIIRKVDGSIQETIKFDANNKKSE